jgi:hypothetical protein
MDSTKAIVFFGTPHEGLRTHELEKMMDAESGGYESSRHKLLEQLRDGSDFLESQKDDLSYIWGDFNPRIISFYETVKTRTVRKVVTIYQMSSR